MISEESGLFTYKIGGPRVPVIPSSVVTSPFS